MNSSPVQLLLCYLAVFLLAAIPLLWKWVRTDPNQPLATNALATPTNHPNGGAVALLGFALLFLSPEVGAAFFPEVSPSGESVPGLSAGRIAVAFAFQCVCLLGYRLLFLAPSLGGHSRIYRTAFWTWAIAAPLVYLIHFGCTYSLEEVDTHPLVKSFGKSHLWFQMVLCTQAVLLSPLIEEWFFRGALLQWQIAPRDANRPQVDLSTEYLYLFSFFMVLLGRQKKGMDAKVMAYAFLEAFLFAGCCWAIMVLSLRWGWLRRRFPNFDDRIVRATFANAVFFAAIHAGVWPSPIPLFFLALVLSTLAVRTGGFWASFIVHALFNAISTVLLFFS